ncbi:hypothetical protein Mal4_02210 [Maioricimonas rarisocia]|uniref:Inner membrane protein n=1 Tax=Maioricimonas rarisocia TaxID=2528026 RepID=A0A517Z0K8_9PLAN|nr:metal-dependent hydrolase [Maioricimonas rarisocia]QDU35939.1 hypothetical protein Mal4_02210 [Maioricimonas rarisocia]
MAAFREHVSVSGLLGLSYGLGTSLLLGFTPVQGALAGWLTAVAGMLPDLDSDRGRPVRELFGILAAVAPLLLVGRVLAWTGMRNDTETVMILLVVMYLAIRYGLAWLVNTFSVHRGMFHSLPAMIIAAEVTYLGYPSELTTVKLLMGGGVAVGFFSHLLLDEMYSVQLNGIRVRFKKSWGTAIKLVGERMMPNVITYALLLTLTYAMLSDAGLIRPKTPQQPAALPHADAGGDTGVLR